MFNQGNDINMMDAEDIVRRVKKHRRGKKRPYEKFFSDISVPALDCSCTSDSKLDKMADMGVVNVGETKKRRKMLRPPYNPRAPHNSTQFLIEDRQNSNVLTGEISPLYTGEVSLFDGDHDTPRAKLSTTSTPVYPDLDLDNLDTIDEVDTLSFMEKDFEDVFSGYYIEQPHVEKTKEELISDVVILGEKLQKTEQELHNTCQEAKFQRQSQSEQAIGLRKLLTEMEHLRAVNQQLREENQILTACQ